MNAVAKVLQAVHTASSTTRFPVAPRMNAPITAAPEETIHLIRAFTRIEDPRIRMFLCDLVETLASTDDARAMGAP